MDVYRELADLRAAVAAARAAMADAGLAPGSVAPERVAVVIGNGGGGLTSLDTQYERLFVEHGHNRCKCAFGKRAAQRYFVVSGPARLRAARLAFLAGVRT